MQRFYKVLLILTVFISALQVNCSVDTVWTKFTFPTENYTIKFSPDGKQLLTGGNKGKIEVWDAFSGALLRSLDGNSGTIYCVDFSSDGKFLAAANSLSVITIWDYQSGEVVQVIDHYDGVDTRKFRAYSLKFSNNGKYLAAVLMHGSQTLQLRDVLIWDTESWELVSQISEFKDVFDIDFSPDDSIIAIANIPGNNNYCTIGIYDVPSLQPISVIEDNLQCGISKVSFSPDGKYFSAALKYPAGVIWNTSDWSLFSEVTGKDATVISFSPDSKYFVAGNFGAKKWIVDIWDNEKNIKTNSYRLDWLMKEYQFIDEGDMPRDMDIDKNTDRIAIIGNIGIYVINPQWIANSVKYSEIDNLTAEIFPNPSTYSANVSLNLPNSAFVKIELYDSNSEIVRNICDEYLNEGLQTIKLQTEQLASGVYYLLIKADDSSKVLKLLITK